MNLIKRSFALKLFCIVLPFYSSISRAGPDLSVEKSLLQLNVDVRLALTKNAKTKFELEPDFLRFLIDLTSRAKNMNDAPVLRIELFAGAKDSEFSSFESMANIGAFLLRKLVSLGWNGNQIQMAVNSLSSPLKSKLKLNLGRKTQ